MSNHLPGAGATDSSNSGVPDYYDRLQRDHRLRVAGARSTTAASSLGARGPARAPAGRGRHAVVLPRHGRRCRALGRVFTDDEGEVGNEKKVLLSDALVAQPVRRRSRGDLARTCASTAQPYTIVGVMPRGFEALRARHRCCGGRSRSRPEQKSDEQRHSNNWWNVGTAQAGRDPRAGAGPGRRAQRREPGALSANTRSSWSTRASAPSVDRASRTTSCAT